MRSLDRFAEVKLDRLETLSLRRSLVETARANFPYVQRDGQRLISFSCNDYLGLSQNDAVKAAAIAATEAHGAGAGASRLVTGNHPLYTALEARLAQAKNAQAACVFGSGYLANIGVIGVLAGPEDLVVIDELAHACLHAGARLSGAGVVSFRHNDAEDAARLLAAHRGACRHALVVTETVFSMDGDRAPLGALSDVAATQDAWLMTDDAHGFGVVPHTDVDVPLQMGTLSKALGSYGGYVSASRPVVDLIRSRARSLIYSTGLPPACAASALAALDQIAANPELTTRPLAKARRFTGRVGLPDAQSPIVPWILGGPDVALAASTALAEAGFLVTAIRPPTVPEGTARLRFAFSALHADEDIDRLADALLALPSPSLNATPEDVSCRASS